MNDLKKSVALRVLLWVGAMGVATPIVIGADLAFDKLPVWFTPGIDHHFIESVLFWGTVGSSIWRWLSRRVWVSSVSATEGKSP